VHAARELCRRSFAVLRFDFRGSGESRGLSEELTISEEIGDLISAVGWLHNKEEVSKERIGVIGLSLDGVVAPMAASQDEEIRDVCTWGTPAELKGLQSTAKNIFGETRIEESMAKSHIDLPSGDRTGRGFLIDASKHDISKSITQISHRPILIIHGAKDQLVPVSHAEKLFEQAREPKEKFVIEGADHTFNRWDWQWEVINRTAEWF